MEPRAYLAGAVALAILIWWPHDQGWLVRLGYLVLVPLVLWLVLFWVWKRWRPSKAVTEHLDVSLLAATSGLFLAWVFEPLYDGFRREEDASHMFNMFLLFGLFFWASVGLAGTKD